MNIASPRTRRVVGTAPAPKQATAKMKALAKTFYEENNASNKHKRAADKARKDLFVEMKDAAQEPFTFTTTIEGKTKTLAVGIAAAQRSGIDVEKLMKLVPLEDFLKMISASIESVTEHAGSIIAAQCTVTFDGKENVNVKEAK